jgi:lipopolysaccharide export LptBFGC system permease protein LptF
VSTIVDYIVIGQRRKTPARTKRVKSFLGKVRFRLGIKGKVRYRQMEEKRKDASLWHMVVTRETVKEDLDFGGLKRYWGMNSEPYKYRQALYHLSHSTIPFLCWVFCLFVCFLQYWSLNLGPTL